MNMYDLMKLAEKYDEDMADFNDVLDEIDIDDFKAKYKEFYSDIKLSIREDW